jgi:hypothetical protein
MDSSADHSGSEPVEPHNETSVTAPAGEAAKAAEVSLDAQHTSESVKAEAVTEPVKAETVEHVPEPLKAEAVGHVSEPIKAEAATTISEPVKAEVAKDAGAEAAKQRIEPTLPKAPGSALITLVANAERFDPRQEAPKAEKAAPRWRKSDLLTYGSRAALVVFLLGFGYLVSGQFLHANTPAKPEQTAKAPAPALASESAERAELRRATQEMSDEIHSLKASLAALRSSVSQTPNAEEIRNLKKGLDGAKSGLEANKAETSASIAQLNTKLEHLQREQATKLQQALEKAERAEQRSEQRASAVPITTASIPPAAQVAVANPPPAAKQLSQAPLPPAPPQTQIQANAVDPVKKAQQPIANWVVRDVYEGIALVEGPGGAFEVMQGENIPGVGTVKSIERHNNGWVVVTNHGLVEYARE